MLKPQFLLTHKIPITIYRIEQGGYVDGDYKPGTMSEVPIMGNIQPFKPHELMMLPEADRSRSWWKLYTADKVRTLKEGDNGWAADEFDWKEDRYQIMKVDDWTEGMGILEHCKAICVRLPRTPN